ncbi:MATE family efflux transporter [Rhizobium leguminosarum bv. trifolii]|uniref:MATE family efflux transporter n=1 Tax=Rhizobium leguminosarum bv. trifolii TaxID=386 RepID=A0A3E1BZE3_RHILT|nr:MATE family efflux transporter [Rhizobium leguminosarum]RFC00684.1 MATE family efflux transporter [Rhizobium leguminosarum bv. trifolii]RFC01141.1 MATE family efflux transporter [Rhizobium leguminosarum bv. trifolii]
MNRPSSSNIISVQQREIRLGVLDGPIIPTILSLATPTILVLVVQTLVGVAETYFISFLGTDALAGVSLVFPILMLMQMMSNGGIGGGTAAAIARALGAGRRGDADALVWHSIVLAFALGGIFTALALLFGSILFRSMGGEGQTLTAAVTYSSVVFSGSVPIWITALLSSALRGAGNPRIPALVIFGGTIVLLPLSPALIFGWGPFPILGIAGGGLAIVVYYLIAAVALVLYLRSPNTFLKLKVVPLERRLFGEILGVGLLSAIGTVQVNLTVTFVTAAVGHFGVDALAGYGIASRLDYLQIPVIFGLGTAIVTMVGLNIGANQIERARRIAWIGAFLAFGFSGIIGIIGALWPAVWMRIFSDDPDVLNQGSLYLKTVAPFYGSVGLGLALYFASQGAKSVLLPVLAGTVRMVIAAFLGWSAVQWLGVDLISLYGIVAFAALVYGALTAAAIYWGKWTRDAVPYSSTINRLERQDPPR